MAVKRYSDYDRFAQIYNKHWGNSFIFIVLPVFDQLVLPYIPEKARILDLCCGTGQLVQILATRDYQLTGVDGSEEMINFARQNAPTAEFIVGDARSFKLPEEYHTVISTFDSLNHIMTIEELTSVFRNVHFSLKQGGLFLFDLNMEEGYKICWNDAYNIVEEDHVCVVRTNYDFIEKTARFDTTIFYWQDGWQRSDIPLTQKCYSKTEIESALENAGFIEIHSYAYDEQLSLVELTEKSERAFFICQKEGEL
ncbi:class I SAM-dependent DNA methyltransferase [Chloroflexota bacterium]